MADKELECLHCDWVGNYDELIGMKSCPLCNHDKFMDLDAVGEDDYREQQSGDRYIIE